MDNTLLAYLQIWQAGQADEHTDLLERLILEEAAPVVRRTIRYRLHFYISERGTSPTNPDAEDLYHDILARLVSALRRLVDQRRPPGIVDFRQYAQRVAINGCNDYLRTKYPERTRLRDRLRDLLERQSEFGLWREEGGRQLCGRREWQGSGVVSLDPDRVAALEISLELTGTSSAGLTAGVVRGPRLVALLTELFRQLGGPVDLDDLVGVVAARLGVTEHRLEPLETESGGAENNGPRAGASRGLEMATKPGVTGLVGPESRWLWKSSREDGAVGLERHIDERIALRRMWEIWVTLPPRPRDTFFYSFSTSRGEDLLTLLFEAGVATPSQVAGVLGITLEELLASWREMPMRNVELAARWGVERQQVNKWRFQAMKMIEKRLL
jgi:RNA polymerase sigma factor (sigma-70 family)